MGGRADVDDRQRIAIEVRAREYQRQLRVFRTTQGLGGGDRRVVDRRHRDRDRGGERVDAAIVDLEAEAVGTGEVEVRLIDQVRRGAAQRAVGRGADGGDRQRIAIEVGAGHDDRQVGVFRTAQGLGGGDRRVVDGRDRDRDRRGERIDSAIVDLEAEAVGTGEVEVRLIDQVRRGAAQRAVGRGADSDKREP